MNRFKLSIFILIVFGVIIGGVPLYAKGKSEAPGQTNKAVKANGPKAIIGEVDTVTDDTVVLKEKRQKEKTKANVGNNVRVVNQDKKLMKLKNLKPKDLVAIVSTESGEEATDGAKPKKKVRVYVREATASAQSKRRAVHGVITDIQGAIITLAHQIHRERVYSIMVGEETTIKLKGVVGASVVDLMVGQRVACVGTLNEEGQIVCKRIHVIPGKATGIFERLPVATPTLELEPTATPSATGTPTIEPSLTPTGEPTTPSATPTTEISPSPTPTEAVTPTEEPTPTIEPTATPTL